MSIKTVPVQFSDGFVGPPTPRTNTGAGVPDSQNVVLSPDGSALMPINGYRRTYPYNLLYKPRAGKLTTQTASVSVIVLSNPASGTLFTIAPSSAGGNEYYTLYTNPVSVGTTWAITLTNLVDTLTLHQTNGIAASASDNILTFTASNASESYEFYSSTTYAGSNIGVALGSTTAATLANFVAAINAHTSIGLTASLSGLVLSLILSSTTDVYTFTTATYPVRIGSDLPSTLSNLVSSITNHTAVGLTASASGYILTLKNGSITTNPDIDVYFPSSGFPVSWMPTVVIASQSGSSSAFTYSSALSTLPSIIGFEDSYGDTLVYTVSTAAWVHTCSDNSILDAGIDTDDDTTNITTVSVSADWATQMGAVVNKFAWFDSSDDLGNYTEITNSLLVVSFPPQALKTNGGVGLAVVDQVTGRPLALAFHPGGQVPDPVSVPSDRPPKLLGALNRQGTQDAVRFLHFQGLTHLVTPWDVHYVYDGNMLRQCGIRAPYGAPELASRTVDYTTADEAANIVDETKWLYGPTASGWSCASYCTITATNSAGQTSADNSSTTDTDDDGTLDTGEYLFLQYRPKNLKKSIICTLASPSYPSTPTGYSPASIRVEKSCVPNSGSLNSLYWKITYSDGTVQTVQFGTQTQYIPLYWSKTLSTIALYNRSDKKSWVRVAFRVYVEWYSSQAGVGNPFWSEATRRFCFSWYDSKRMRESAPSAYTDKIDMSETAYRLNIGGALRGYCSDWNNDNPEPATVDKVRIYAHNTTWGNNDLSYPYFRLVGSFDIPTADTNGDAWVNLPGTSDDDLLTSSEPMYDNNVPPGGAAIEVDGNRLVIGNQPSFSVGKCVCTTCTNKLEVLKCYINSSAEKVWALSNPTGKTFTCSTVVTDTLASWKCSDGTYAWCETWDRATGTVTAGTYTYSRAYSPAWGPWLEGRTVDLGDYGQFLIAKARDAYMLVYKGDSDDYEGLDSGDTYLLMDYEVLGNPAQLTWTAILTGGLDAESTPAAGYKLLDMPGDEILALGHCGEFLVAIGKSHIVYLSQDTGQVDGLSTSGDPFPNPRSDQGGCVSGRSFVQLANQQALMFGTDGKLVSLSSNGAEVLPVSERFKGYITSQYRVSASSLKNAHAVFDAPNNRYVLFIADSTVGNAGTDTTDKRYQWPDAPPLDDFVAWETQS